VETHSYLRDLSKRKNPARGGYNFQNSTQPCAFTGVPSNSWNNPTFSGYTLSDLEGGRLGIRGVGGNSEGQAEVSTLEHDSSGFPRLAYFFIKRGSFRYVLRKVCGGQITNGPGNTLFLGEIFLIVYDYPKIAHQR